MPVPSNVYVRLVTVTGPYSANVALNGEGLGIDEYQVRWSYNRFQFWQETSVVLKQLTIGLSPKQNYLIRVRAHNASGWSAWSGDYSFFTPAAPPSAPIPFYIDAQGSGGFHYLFHPSENNGGAAITDYQVVYGTDPNAGQYSVASTGDTFVWNLTRNTTYYVWSRARNEAGWGEYSVRYQITTQSDYPNPPVPTYLGDETQTSLRYDFSPGDNGGSAILEYEVGYSGNPNAIENTISVGLNTSYTLNNLAPGIFWFVWSRQRNQQGWSAWSIRSQAKTIAGIRVNDAGVWKDAVPYVKVGGVWRLALPYVKSVGLWKKSI